MGPLKAPTVKNMHFKDPRWQTAAILKTTKSPFLRNYSTDFDKIWHSVGAFLQATSRVPRWWIGERPPDMAASCDIYK